MSAADPGTPPLRVLCVDDNPDVADSEAMLLRTVGFEARACYGGAEALGLAESFRPGVCLIDLSMPGMAGDELARRLRDWAAGRPLVLVAVTAMRPHQAGDRLQAFDLHLVKPVDPRQLLAVVDRLWESFQHSQRRS